MRIALPLALALTFGGATAAFAAPAAGAQAHTHAGRHHGHGARGPSVFVRASQLSSLSAAQKSQVQDLMRADQAQRDAVKASRGRVMGALAGQVQSGSIDKNALSPVLKSDIDLRVATSVKEQALRQQLHNVLNASQVQELGGGKDFLKPARGESDIRAKIQKHEDKRLDRLQKKVGQMSPDARTKLAERLRKHAS